MGGEAGGSYADLLEEPISGNLKKCQHGGTKQGLLPDQSRGKGARSRMLPMGLSSVLR